jgi:1-acyl-sn-glycerol-3-phosphate acyltransferase
MLGVPCVPMALNTGLVWPAKGFMRYPGTAVFEFLPMIPAGLKRAEFMATLEERIETASAHLLAEGRRHPARMTSQHDNACDSGSTGFFGDTGGGTSHHRNDNDHDGGWDDSGGSDSGGDGGGDGGGGGD